jgi:CheY-like chemotaxis protein
VLVVDDLHANLDVAAGLMRKYNMQVDCATSGQEAIDRIRFGKPVYNAVFMDHMMPEMDGIETADRIRELGTEYAQKLPIIALTANAVAGTEELFYAHGFQAFITKPIDIMRLDSVLMEWVRDKSKDQVLTESQKEEKPNIEIPGVNAEKGLSICGGDGEIYRTVLRSYAADTTTVLEKIREVTTETLQDYRIAVHGIKGSSANIGAEAIRQKAANLEIMAQNGNLSGILDQNDALLHETESLVADIKAWFEKQADHTVKPQLPEPDRELLTRLRQSCEEFDSDNADKVMKELESANYDKDAELVTWLREKIDTFDFDEIAGRLADYDHASNSLATSHTEH